MREPSKFTILHLSDVHATVDGLLYGRVDGLARLRQVGDYVAAAGVTPEAVVVTGDLVQRGHWGAYDRINEALRELGDQVGAPVLTVLGNHDAPEEAWRLSGHSRGHHRVVTVGALRLVLLDSSSGTLGPDQLAWLAEAVADPFGMGTIVAMHHAPVRSPLPTLSKVGLRDPHLLADALRGSDTRLILAGHYHHPMNALFHGIPVAVGPSLAYHQVMNAGPSTVSGHDLAMFSLVQITDDQVSAAPVSLQAAHPLFTTSVSPFTHAAQR